MMIIVIILLDLIIMVLPIDLILVGIVTVVRETQLAQKSLPNNVINKLKQLVYVIYIVIFMIPIEVTLLGMLIDISDEDLKA